jgi:hypothetical protein
MISVRVRRINNWIFFYEIQYGRYATEADLISPYIQPFQNGRLQTSEMDVKLALVNTRN